MGKGKCPCCGYYTMDDGDVPGSYFICPVCFWEDDYVQFHNPDMKGGANNVSLNVAKENYLKYGVSEEKFLKDVRKPKPDELKEEL